MSDKVLLKVYYFGQILLQTSEGVKFVCENPLDVVIPFTISFEELKGVIYEKIDYYNSDSEEEFESNYEVVGPNGNEDQGDRTMAPNVTEVANALANEEPFEEPSFMRVLDLEAMHVAEFPEYMSAEIFIVADGEFAVGMEFNPREAVIKAIKEYTIRRSVDYQVYEYEPLTFYAKCRQYGSGCDWLIRVSMISRKYCWVIRRYNGSHTSMRLVQILFLMRYSLNKTELSPIPIGTMPLNTFE
ncbi:hypothetical protein Ahy_A02g006813 [Arachis hypogaea]|uniref:Transposase MuDR plant domain-containing protein n=1 Tax=Arachis hypogaea TaxID=3818 RepID=A0A445EBC3_ARAHY|nr:hypothetical protein Ahy_A02g006813 [Arachis hypogaea]